MSVDRRSRQFYEWCHNHPFTTALVVLLLVITPGFIRIEQLARRANTTAAETRALTTAQANQNAFVGLGNCRGRNSAQRSTRMTFLRLYAALDAITPPGQGHGFTDYLRATLGTQEKEDRDCNGDGRLNEDDYADCPGNGDNACPSVTDATIPPVPASTTTTATVARRSSRGTTAIVVPRFRTPPPTTTTTMGSGSGSGSGPESGPCIGSTPASGHMCISVPAPFGALVGV